MTIEDKAVRRELAQNQYMKHRDWLTVTTRQFLEDATTAEELERVAALYDKARVAYYDSLDS